MNPKQTFARMKHFPPLLVLFIVFILYQENFWPRGIDFRFKYSKTNSRKPEKYQA